jgi:hypothetical protein
VFGSAENCRRSAAAASGDQINNMHDLFAKYPETLLFGEDVAQKGGVYTVTKGLHKAFKNARVFNTLLDETMILGLAQGFGNMGMLPVPEIQYLAYFHNACDQIRGEAASLQFFSNGQYRNPMVMRIASLGYQRGFGGHFHNDNSITRCICSGFVKAARHGRRCGDDAAHAAGAGEGRRPRVRVPGADRAVHDERPLRTERRPVAVRLSATGSGDDARRGARLLAGGEGSRDHHFRQRRDDEPACRARDRKDAWLEGPHRRPALAGAAERRLARHAGHAHSRVDEGRQSASVSLASSPRRGRTRRETLRRVVVSIPPH